MTSNDDGNVTQGRVLIKHMMSCARDATVTYVIDWPKKTIAVSMTTYAGKPFVAATLLEQFIRHILPKDFGIQAYDDDNTLGFVPDRTDWTVFFDVGGQRLGVRLIKQISVTAHEAWALELDPEEAT